MDIKTSKIIRTQHTLELTGQDILSMLRLKGQPLPASSTVTVEVPTGGDWSGMTLDIEGDTPIKVRYETVATED